jgi:F-type H+-transporting ATPase subunit gamma
MATLRQIRDRVKSLRNTQQITRAMKMVAGARIRRAEQAMRAARPYADALTEMLRELVAAGGARHPLLSSRPVQHSGILVMTADKGLAGAFNSNLVRAALLQARERSDPAFYVVGLKGRLQLRAARRTPVADWLLQSKPFAELAREIAQRVITDFTEGRIDELTLVSSRFISTIVQRPTPVQLLPVAPPQSQEQGARQAQAGQQMPTPPQSQAPQGHGTPLGQASQSQAHGEAAAGAPGAQSSRAGAPLRNAFEFEPDAGHVLAELVPRYLEFSIYQALLETQASEFAARLIAMTNATDNAGKLIDELTIVMNKTRQAAITKEILEIVGGAEALKG